MIEREENGPTLMDVLSRKYNLMRYGRACRRAKNLTSRKRRAVNATRLWNWAGAQWMPETYWEILRHHCPDRFCGPSANDHVFAYYDGDHYASRMREYLASDGWPIASIG